MKMNIKHQQQPTDNSCMVTCLAMFLGEPVEEIYNQYHEELYITQRLTITDILGFRKVGFYLAPPGRHSIIGNVVAFLTVPSINNIGSQHEILLIHEEVAEGSSHTLVLDPQMGWTDKKYYIAPGEEPQNEWEVELTSWNIDCVIPYVIWS